MQLEMTPNISGYLKIRLSAYEDAIIKEAKKSLYLSDMGRYALLDSTDEAKLIGRSTIV
jgi:hypothetical protein